LILSSSANPWPYIQYFKLLFYVSVFYNLKILKICFLLSLGKRKNIIVQYVKLFQDQRGPLSQIGTHTVKLLCKFMTFWKGRVKYTVCVCKILKIMSLEFLTIVLRNRSRKIWHNFDGDASNDAKHFGGTGADHDVSRGSG
jgi:hypothetical protein